MKRLFLPVLALAFTWNAFGQMLPYKQGELLIQMEYRASVYDLVQQFQYFEGHATGLQVLAQVVESSRIWLLVFDFTVTDQRELAAALRRHQDVMVVQNNHFVHDRGNTPNDPNFSSQWHHVNIQSEDAWDITTGGTTALGDEIVVAVLDDGINLNHPDLAANLWINVNEIAGNGIDDDGNGYIDDIYGWNTSNNTPNVGTGGSHGTPVSGMIGAVGNNNIGIVGANWDVKIMTIRRGSTTEAGVLSAYAYPLIMRRMYNQTNGSLGAFVVATNASWGIDYGQPANAPLWCAFYDTLGLEGILNCGATTNSNLNVDLVGDLPTACPSDFMIGVTATNNNDIRTFSGYGLTTIALGAPGASVVTTNSSGGHSATSGTSFASPLTAGVIALMYSAPCPTIIELAKSDPPQAALQMKTYLIEGVDQTPQLLNETYSGGRLNSFNSVNLVMQNCSDCPAPFSVAANEVDISSASVSWNQLAGVDTVNIRYRVQGAADWIVVNHVTSPYDFSGLLSCTVYEYAFQPVCTMIDSVEVDTVFDFGMTNTFKTDGCCDLPADFAIVSYDSTTVYFQWGDVTAAQNFVVEYKEAESTAWITYNIQPGTAYQIGDLLPCTEYEVRLYTDCDTASSSTTDIFSFVTKGCGACIDLTYCLHEGGSTEDEWIAQVQVGDLSHTSGPSDGYMDYTGEVATDLAMGGTYQITVTPGFSGTSWNQVHRVWIDYNQNGEFEASELVMGNTTPTSQPVTGSFTVPTNIPTGITRMRVAMRYNSAPAPCGSYAYGEVLDFCVNIVSGFDCSAPQVIELEETDFSSISLSWSEALNAEQYEVHFRQVGVSSWTTIVVQDIEAFLGDLNDCTSYEFRLRTLCESPFVSGLSPIHVFSTECYPCEQNVLPDTFDVSSTSAGIFWEPVEFATSYRVQYRQAGAASWALINTTSTSVIIPNLVECTDYEARVRATCSNTDGEYTQEIGFTTACLESSASVPAELGAVKVYPVPATDKFTIAYTLRSATVVRLEVYTVTGQRVIHNNYGNLPEGDGHFTLNRDQLGGAGIYFIRIFTDRGSWSTRVVML